MRRLTIAVLMLCPLIGGFDLWARSPVFHPLRDVHFLDRLNGWIIGDAGLIRTRDGGRSWSWLKPIAKGAFEDHWLPYAGLTGVVADGEEIWLAWRSRLFVGVNRGENWIEKELPQNLCPAQEELSLIGLDVRDGQIRAVGKCSRGEYHQTALLLISPDLGESWRRVELPKPPSKMIFADVNRGWLLLHKSVLSTEDGGFSWATSLEAETSALRDLFFLDAEYGWALDDWGRMWKTEDGGGVWRELRFEDRRSFRRIWFRTPRDGWLATGRGPTVSEDGEPLGEILRTDDGGLTWRPVRTIPAAADVNAFFFPDEMESLLFLAAGWKPQKPLTLFEVFHSAGLGDAGWNLVCSDSPRRRPRGRCLKED